MITIDSVFCKPIIRHTVDGCIHTYDRSLQVIDRKHRKGSCVSSDENTLLVRGDKRFAAIIATEFLRMYDHYKIRYWINRMKEANDSGPMFLNDTPAWSNIYFRRSNRSRKFRDREVFSGTP